MREWRTPTPSSATTGEMSVVGVVNGGFDFLYEQHFVVGKGEFLSCSALIDSTLEQIALSVYKSSATFLISDATKTRPKEARRIGFQSVTPNASKSVFYVCLLEQLW